MLINYEKQYFLLCDNFKIDFLKAICLKQGVSPIISSRLSRHLIFGSFSYTEFPE